MYAMSEIGRPTAAAKPEAPKKTRVSRRWCPTIVTPVPIR